MKKLGLWLPPRESMQVSTKYTDGKLLKPLRDNLVARLKKELDVQENIDFRKAIIKNNKVYLKNLCLNELDGFFWYGQIDRTPDSYHMDVLKILANDIVVINDPTGVKTGLDKFLSASVLNSKKIRTPEFYLLPQDYSELSGEFPLLLKPRYGSFGVGIVKIEDRDMLRDIIDYQNSKDYYLEKFIPHTQEDWIGVNVIGGKIAYSYGKKPGRVSGWKVYDREKLGGEMILKDANTEQKRIALEVAKITNLDLVGVDIIGTENEYYVIDVNTFPGLYPEMFEKAGIDGAGMIADAIVERLRK